MSELSLRFLHASDLHLEQPLYGLPELPDAWRELLIDAPYLAAERVFDAAVRERVDFLILSGDVLAPRLAGPRGIQFLVDQFHRLDSHGIAVYWAGAAIDRPELWPSHIKLPGGVQVFPHGRIEEVTHMRGDGPLATLLGTSGDGGRAAGEFRTEGKRLFTIGVVPGDLPQARLKDSTADFWALGGKHQRETLEASPEDLRARPVSDEPSRDRARPHPAPAPAAPSAPHTLSNATGAPSLRPLAHYCGTPQGRCPAEAGPHGCSLVSVDTLRHVRVQLIPTDVVRWHQETLSVPRDIRQGDLEQMLAERGQALTAQAAERRLIVHWHIRGAQKLANWSRRESLANELTLLMRQRFGGPASLLWTSRVEFEELPVPDAWKTEESLLGDFIRSIRELEGSRPQWEEELVRSAALVHEADAVELARPAARRRLLAEATRLGARLLAGDDALAASPLAAVAAGTEGKEAPL